MSFLSFLGNSIHFTRVGARLPRLGSAFAHLFVFVKIIVLGDEWHNFYTHFIHFYPGARMFKAKGEKRENCKNGKNCLICCLTCFFNGSIKNLGIGLVWEIFSRRIWNFKKLITVPPGVLLRPQNSQNSQNNMVFVWISP